MIFHLSMCKKKALKMSFEGLKQPDQICLQQVDVQENTI